MINFRLLSLSLLAPTYLLADGTCPSGKVLLDLLVDNPIKNFEEKAPATRTISSMDNLVVKFMEARDAGFVNRDGTVGGKIGFGLLGKNAQEFNLKTSNVVSNIQTCDYDVKLKPDQSSLKGPVSFSLQVVGTKSEIDMPTYNICPPAISNGINGDAASFMNNIKGLSEGKTIDFQKVKFSIPDKINQDSLKSVIVETGKYSPTLNFVSYKLGQANQVECTYRYKRHIGPEYLVVINTSLAQK